MEFVHLVLFLNSIPIKKNWILSENVMVTLVLNEPEHARDLIMLCENLSSDVRTYPFWDICCFLI